MRARRRLRPGAVVAVTGVSSGVGRAVVRMLAGRGVRVGLLARVRDGLEAAAEEVQALDGEALVLPVDVADAEAVRAAAQAVVARWGALDVRERRDGSVFSPFEAMTPDEFERVTAVTCLG